MGKSSSEPSTPDPYTVAGAQTQSNEQTAEFNAALNRYNQNTPMGSSTWTENPYGQWTNQESLTPALQQAAGSLQWGQAEAGSAGAQQLQNSMGTLSNPLNTSNLPGIQSSVNTNFGNQVNQAQQSSYNAQEALLQPQMQQQQESLQSQLAAEGAPQGSTAYNNAINNQALQNNFTNTQVANNAVQTGNAMQNQLFGQSLSAGQFQNQANQQGLQQDISLQDQPISVWQGLQGSGIQMPQFSNSAQSNASPTDLSSDVWNAYEGNVNSANASNAASNQETGELTSLAATAAMAFMMY
jgi:hypothetical protein